MENLAGASHGICPGTAQEIPLGPPVAAVPVAQVLQQALARQQAGRLSDAETQYQTILRTDPRNPEAHYNLGMLALQRGRPAAGLPHFQSAWETNPSQGPYWLRFIDALIQVGRLDEASQVLTAGRQHGLAGAAVDQLEMVLLSRQEKESVVSLFQAGRLDEAELLARELTRRFPGDGFAWKVLGTVLAQQGQSQPAWHTLQKAIGLFPHDAETHNTLGVVLKALGRLDEAVTSYHRALTILPDYAEAHGNLGHVLKDLGRLEEAVKSYQRAVTIQPDQADVHNHLGNVLTAVGRADEALVSFQQAVAIQPDYAEAHYNLGNALKDLGRLEEAVKSYRRAVAIRPDYANAHSNLSNALKDLGRLDEAVAGCQRALEIRPEDLAYRSNLLFLYAFARVGGFEQEYAEARKWEQVALSAVERQVAHDRALEIPARQGRPLRLGIVSAELGHHAVSDFLIPFLGAVDRKRLTLLLYPTTSRDDPETDFLRAIADSWSPLGSHSDADAAAHIRADSVDILLDTTGHTQGCRLGIFAHRAAPVQCHYIGYAGTTGLTEMDYFLADSVLIPSDLDQYFQETIWRLPRPWVAYGPLERAPDPAWRPAGDGRIRLGSFNNLTKLSDSCLSLWARALRALPEATLLLKDKLALDGAVQRRIVDTLATHGVQQDRVTFLPQVVDWRQHMSLYDQLDIALDTIPFGSGTTGFDALWMGVPLITLAGNWLGGRMGASMLLGMGHPEWIARTDDEYVAKVVSLGRDGALRTRLRTTQRQRMRESPLCDGPGLARALEDTFEAMFDKWWAGRQAATNSTTFARSRELPGSAVRTITPDSDKLHLGCGKRYIPGFFHIDLLAAPHVDLCHRVDVLPFANDSVGLIYASHLLEHFGRSEVEGVLQEWHRVIRPGGLLRLAVPDFAAVVAMYASEGLRDGKSGLVGLISGGQRDMYDYHKIIFDEPFLTFLLRTTGFRNVRRWDWRCTEHAHIDDYSQAHLPHLDKEHGRLMSLNLEADK